MTLPTQAAWIRSKPSRDARLRLFCFPYAGAGASSFASWAAELPDKIDVCAVQLPGREDRLREPLFRRAADLARALAVHLRPLLDRPFAFFGHSMGAVLGFELARQLRREALDQPVGLFLAARRAPQLAMEPPMYQMSNSDLMEEIRIRYGGIPAAVAQNAELMEIFLPILRADFELIDTYQYEPEPPLACPIHVFGGEQDRVRRADLEAWERQTDGPFQLKMFPGDHFFLKSAQTELLSTLSAELLSLVE